MEKGRDRVVAMLKELAFFDHFGEANIREFASFMSLQNVSEGTVLFREGDLGEYLFFIVEGVVEVSVNKDNNSHQVIATVGTGSAVGEMSLIDDYERSATVQAATDMEILILTKSKFRKLLEDSPQLGIMVLQGLARSISVRLRASQGRFRDFV